MKRVILAGGLGTRISEEVEPTLHVNWFISEIHLKKEEAVVRQPAKINSH